MSTNNKMVNLVIAAVALVLGDGCRKDKEDGATGAATVAPAQSATAVTPANKKPLTAARLATLEAYDFNRNGRLDPAEQERMDAERKTRIEALKAQINARYDQNGNGRLEPGEVQTMQADRNKLSVFKGAALRRYDVNHNGVLDPAERDRMVVERQELVRNARAGTTAHYDTNHDGVLDLVERAAMRGQAGSGAAPTR
jgi:hypothetical protein